MRYNNRITRETMRLCLALHLVASFLPLPVACAPLGNASRGLSVRFGDESVAFAYSGGGRLSSFFVESADLLWPAYDALRLRVYVDGEAKPSIDVPMGFFDAGDISPWGQLSLGNTGSAGAEYIFAGPAGIAFTSAVRVAFALGTGDLGPHTINVIVRGRGPSAAVATRAATLCVQAAVPSPARVVLFNSTAVAPPPSFTGAAGGQLRLLGLSASASNMSYLDGSLTLCASGACALVSYGLESFFLAEVGLGIGKYTTHHAGITAVAPLLGHSVIAWRDLSAGDDGWFDDDLTLFWDVPAGAGDVTLASCAWATFGVAPALV